MNEWKLVVVALAMLAGAGAAAQESDDGGAPDSARRKNPGDMSYRSAWWMQKKAAALLPKTARLVTPSLRLSIAGMPEAERAEFMPQPWAVAIVGRTLEARVPMRRGGYFEVPAMPQAASRREDAIVMFNAQSRRNVLDIGWHLNLPASGTLAYSQFGQALDEIKLAQAGIAWWDVMLMGEKKARFDSMRACFSSGEGAILVGGRPAGKKLSAHCSLLPFEPGQLGADPAIAFAGQLDYVTFDNSANYPAPQESAAQAIN